MQTGRSTLLRHEDYTVAWIAILPIEVEAALGVLDRRHHGHFESVRGDDYTYIGGEINGHNVVIAKLPAGQNYGVGAAAALVNQVKIRFENIWFALLVGVAAGLPNLSSADLARRRDIRLGDVLVCVPDQSSTGIIHYDLGKNTEAGFVTNGRQAEPPALVRSAIGDIQLIKRPFLAGNDLAKLLDRFWETVNDDKFRHPGQDQDELFQIQLGVMPETLVERELRDDLEPTQVWYGRIGSGNTLMRNSRQRDKLRDQYDLIGLEMEAAGVMNAVPTGVVRGVCDYGDGHKSKRWQPYAAAVAAVYTKALLLGIRPKVAINQQESILQSFPFRRNEDFIVRDDLLNELQKALPPRTAFQATALWGLGGSGKTQVALEFAYRRHVNDGFPVFWVHADSYTKFLNGYQQIATAAGLTSELQGDELLRAVRIWLESTQKWLLVLDNADNVSLFLGTGSDMVLEKTTSLGDYIPRGACGSILWTTRDRSAVGSLVGTQRGINVTNMTATEATDLLTNVAGLPVTTDNTDVVLELIEHLERLPLAVTQAALFISEMDLSYTEYLTRYRQQRKRKRLLAVDGPRPFRQDGVPNSVMHTWQITMDHLQAKHPHSAWLLRVIVWYHNESLPQALLEAVGAAYAKYCNASKRSLSLDNDFPDDLSSKHIDERDSDSDNDEDCYRLAVTQLEQFSFLKRRLNVGSTRVYDVHKLVQQVTRYMTEQGHRAEILPNMAGVALGILSQSFPSGEYGTWERCNELFSHATTVCDLVELQDRKLDVCVVLHQTINYLFIQRRLEEAEKITTHVLGLRMEILGNKHSLTILTMADLATIYSQQDRTDEAHELDKKVLAFRREMLGEEDPATIRSMSDLASSYCKRGLLDEGEELHQEALILHKQVYGEQHLETARVSLRLGICYEKQYRQKEAEEIYKQVLTLMTEMLGDKHPDTIQSLYRLAVCHYHQATIHQPQDKDDLLGKAEESYVRVLALRTEILGMEHPDTLRVMERLALCYYDQGRLDEAKKIDLQVLGIRKEILGEEHPETVATAAYMAAAYPKQKQLIELEVDFSGV